MQQVGKQSLSSGLGWGSEGGGGSWSLHTSTSGSGSWTSTANQEISQASSWQSVGKSDSASDAGDDSSSVKSGSTITNISNLTNQQSQDSTTTSASGALSINSSSPWSTSTPLPGMESSPWGNSNSPAPSSMSTIGWSNTPSSLSLSNNQGLQNNMQSGSSISSNASFSSTIGNNSTSGWPSGIASNPSSTTSMPPNLNSGLQSGTIPSQWQGSSMLGNIGDFPKSEPNWNNSNTSAIDSALNKENATDPRMWGLNPDKMNDPQWETPKSQWANSPIGPAGDQVTSGNTELSFAQATLKGLKPPPVATNSQSAASTRNEEMLRAIENHEGWGSRPIRQDTSWDVETSPKSHRKFSTDNNAGASNVWNNSNGTAIWEAVRENQNSNWGGAAVGGNSWNGEKDQNNWAGMPKTPQDHNWGAGAVGNGSDSKSFGMWAGGQGASGDATNKMWGQKTEIGAWDAGNNHPRSNMSSWGDDGEPNNWDDRRAPGGINSSMQGAVPPSPGLPGVPIQGVPGLNNLPGLSTDNPPWNDSQKPGWNQANAQVLRPKMDEPWNKPPPKMSGWGDPTQDNVKVDDGTSIWAANAPKQLPPQAKPAGWGDNSPQGQWNAAVGAKPKTSVGWDDASWAMAQRAKVPPKYVGTGGGHTQMRAKLLQQLMDMGFRKEEAQNALITNNMNLDMAINDLKANNGMLRKDMDMDMFQNNGPQGRMAPYKSNMGGEDLSDSARPDQVPNFTSAMPNTPFPNAQMPNQPFLHNNTSLPPSSLNPNSSSINSNIQQKLIQKMQVPPGNALGPRGQIPPVGSGSNNQVPAQQQQQILAQLRLAILNGFISPQLLNYTLPHNILVLLQQLLQLQSARQNWLIKEQQMLAQGNRGNNRQQLEQMPTIINNINQQMNGLQKQLQQAQNKLFSSQKPPNLSQPPSSNIDPIDAISSELANTNIGNQSRLATHWKPVGDNIVGSDMSTSTAPITPPTSTNSESAGMDKSGNMQAASSNLNLIGLGMTGDRTWSTVSTPSSTSQNWPTSSTDSVSTNTLGDQKTNISSATSSSLTAMPSGFSDVIPEFVPGKPWQGLPKSSIEDDPHVTPGSIQRSLSVNRVHDDSLNNLSGGIKLTNQSGWSSASKSDNSLGLGNLGSRPPPVMAPSKVLGSGPQWQQGNASYNRQSSWAGRSSGNSAFTQVGGSSWGDTQNSISNWIFLKNLNSMDAATVRALCQRHGEVLQFSSIADGQVALIQYGSREVALNAQRALNNFQMGSSIIGAEFISEMDAQRLISQMPPPPPQPSAMTQINASHWSQAPPTAYQQGASRSGQIWSQGNTGWTGSTFWDVPGMGDHNSNPILSNILD